MNSRALHATAWGVATILFVALALAAPVNHDESQYVAGGFLSATALPFRDFMAMQPPLALWVWAPLTVMFPGWSFVAIRLSSALFGLATLAAVAGIERRIGPDRRWPIGAALMACCNAFLFTSTVARNDALPGMLLAIGLLAALKGLRGAPGWCFAAGLSFGAAAAAKLSFAPSAAAAGLMVLIQCRKWPFAAFAAGLLAGLVPLAIGYACAPDAFLFGVLQAPLSAPLEWYARVGDGFDLTAAGKLTGTSGALLVGPALLVIAIVCSQAPRLRRSAEPRFLLVITAAGLVGALLPTPSHPQYLLPMLPPLFALLRTALDGVLYRRIVSVALAMFAIVGLMPSLLTLREFPAIALERQAHGIRMIAHGPIATLSPERAVDSGLALDERFATGPFIFRSGAIVSVQNALRFNTATPATLDAIFRRRPPGAILVGYETAWTSQGHDLDAILAAWAEQHHFRAITLPDGRGKLYRAQM